MAAERGYRRRIARDARRSMRVASWLATATAGLSLLAHLARGSSWRRSCSSRW